jgi:hypothetical protein
MRSVFHSISILALATAAVGFAAPANNLAPEEGKSAPATKAAPVLEKGMTEAQIIAAIGHPDTVKPMHVPGSDLAKAETWVYRRQVGTRQMQVATGTRDVPTFNGMGLGNDANGTRPEPVYSTKFVRIYSVTSLLMIDGKLELARQTTETDGRF